MVTYEVPNFSKFSGSCLIDNNCTCTIKVVKHADGILSTFSCLTHYGHEYELQHVWITQKNRRKIAVRLQQGVPRENILDTIMNSIGDQILREHLIDDQDRVFKYKYLKGKVNRRVDKCLVNLLKFSRDKVFERISKLTKTKNSAKLKRVHWSHLESMNVPFTKVLKQQYESS